MTLHRQMTMWWRRRRRRKAVRRKRRRIKAASDSSEKSDDDDEREDGQEEDGSDVEVSSRSFFRYHSPHTVISHLYCGYTPFFSNNLPWCTRCVFSVHVHSTSKYDYIGLLLIQLHWLKVSERIMFKLAIFDIDIGQLCCTNFTSCLMTSPASSPLCFVVITRSSIVENLARNYLIVTSAIVF